MLEAIFGISPVSPFLYWEGGIVPTLPGQMNAPQNLVTLWNHLGNLFNT